MTTDFHALIICSFLLGKLNLLWIAYQKRGGYAPLMLHTIPSRNPTRPLPLPAAPHAHTHSESQSHTNLKYLITPTPSLYHTHSQLHSPTIFTICMQILPFSAISFQLLSLSTLVDIIQVNCDKSLFKYINNQIHLANAVHTNSHTWPRANIHASSTSPLRPNLWGSFR